MELSFDEIYRRIAEVRPGLHSVGTFSPPALAALAASARRRTIRRSVETGSGVSTLLLSHLSERHTVFALDAGSGSIDNVLRSPLLRRESVTFVEGPTQATLPRHRFDEKLQLVLIDGPHGYPFPDLEYYYLYPHLETGGLLVLDDIQIRTVNHLFRFLRRDAMFRLDSVVRTTAFFTRTAAPTFDPLGDGWWWQNYNATPLLRYTWRERIREALPAPARRILAAGKRVTARNSAGCAVSIVAPPGWASVSATGTVEGSAALPPGSHLWILVRRKDFDGWWPQGEAAPPPGNSRWNVPVKYGEPRDAGCEFEIAAVVVGPSTHDLWANWALRANQTGGAPPVKLPLPEFVIGEARRTVKKRAG